MFEIYPKSYQEILKILEDCATIDEVIIYGSRAKGNFKEGSDIDISGIALNSKSDILAGTANKFEQVTETNTDTVIYSLNKIINLLLNVNPNTIEMLGLDPNQYIYLSDEDKYLLPNFQSHQKLLFFSFSIITNLNTINLLTLFLLIYKQYINSR